jgi:NAD(P)-dependent dehydrogenase (short-subunit alcohol dehydrogenase family)
LTSGFRIDLTGRRALVTGAGQGVGLGIAHALAQAGAHVIVNDIRSAQAEAAVEQIHRTGASAEALAFDVTDWEAVAAAVGAAGTVDVLVNNAGMSPLAPSSAETSEDLFDKVLAVNFKGPFRLGAVVGLRMVDAGGGSIVNVSSTGSLMPQPGFGPYACAKAALNTLTEVLALEYGPTVRVNTLCPGPFLTDVSRWWPEEARTTARSAAGRPGRPEEIVTTALYLASPASSFTTGALVRVDGGLY